MDNLEEIDNFLETYSLPRLTHENTENLSRPISSKEIESLIKKLPTKKNEETDGFIHEFHQNLKKS